MELEFCEYIYTITEGDHHTLIAGCTGSGKSVLLNGIVLNILTIPGSELYLIDPKGVELEAYRRSSHAICYADNAEDTFILLQKAVAEMRSRFKEMKSQGLRKSPRNRQYIIIDELAQFSPKVDKSYKEANELLSQISTLGRAANIFIIACTQRPTQDVITPLVKINFDCKIALRTATKRESINIIDRPDANFLPEHGKCIMVHPAYVEPHIHTVDFFSNSTIDQAIDDTRRPVKRSFFSRILGI